MEPNSINVDPNSFRIVQPANPFVVEEPELGQEQFLELLVAQLENQDPLNPQEDTEFIAQLATFSSLEQLVDLNSRIDGVLAGQTQLVNSQSLNLIGRDVLINSGGKLLLEGGVADEIVVDLAEPATAATVQVFDESGKLVREIELQDLEAGRHGIVWDGLINTGTKENPAWEPADSGTFSFTVRVTGTDGASELVPAMVSLPVEGVHLGQDGLALVSRTQVIDFSRIIEIRISGDTATPDPSAYNKPGAGAQNG